MPLNAMRIRDMLSGIPVTQERAEVVTLHKPPSLDKLAVLVNDARNELVRYEGLLERLDLLYQTEHADISADVNASKTCLKAALTNFYDAANRLGIPVGLAPERA